MRDDKQLEGFLFVSFIALQFYYRIYGKLIEKLEYLLPEEPITKKG